MGRPLNIYLVRHGESEANADKGVYARTPDWRIELTPIGREQAFKTGVSLSHKLVDLHERHGPQSLGAYVSPYRRTVQTWEEIERTINGHYPTPKPLFVIHDPRLIEQGRGNPADREKLSADYKAVEKERRIQGTFYYSFHNGESGVDVWSRINSFEESRARVVESTDYPSNVVIVGHSFTMRVHLMHLLGLDVDAFHKLRDPKNAEIVHLVDDECGGYRRAD